MPGMKDGGPNPLATFAVIAWTLLLCVLPVVLLVKLVMWAVGA